MLEVESTLSTEKLLVYTAALASNMDIENDSMFQSWKKFKTRGAMSCDESSKSVAQSVADECFPVPSSLKRKLPNKESYFVISGDDVHRQKKKNSRHQEKEKRKTEKAKRQLLKQEKKENKQKKREETKTMKALATITWIR